MKLTSSTLILSLGLLSIGLQPAIACTIFCDSQKGAALVGNNEDYIYDLPSKMWFVPATPGAHGRICFGWNFRAQGGVNDQGLFMDGAALGNLTDFNQPQPDKPTLEGHLIERVLANCATVDEAIAFLDKFGYQGNPAHSLIADRFGNSVVCEWYQGQFRPLRKKGRYQLITNFGLSNPQLGGYPCVRNIAASHVLETAPAPSVAECTAALKAAAADYGTSGTTYSQVYDLANGEIYVYYRKHFEKPLKINIAEELSKGLRDVDLQELFEQGTGILAVPKTMTTRLISADELRQKVMDAHGSSGGVTNLHSYRAAGMLAMTNTGTFQTGQVEILAAGPDKFLVTADLKSAGRYRQGFDGQTAWEASPGRAPKTLKDWNRSQYRDRGEMLNWFDDMEHFSPTGKIAVKWFNGRECYEVKATGTSGRETTRYYDATNYFLTGMTKLIETQTGPTWSMMMFDDYRQLGSFAFPTRWSLRGEGEDGEFRIRELQTNIVADLAFALPKEPNLTSDRPKSPAKKKTEPTPFKLDPAIFDAYVGWYKLKPSSYFRIDRDGDRFTARYSGQSAAEIFPASETNFFYKVIDAQITFVRDGQGKVAGFVLHEGEELYAPRIETPVAADVNNSYTGQYRFESDSTGTNAIAPGTLITVGRLDNQLTAQVGQSSGELVPESETNFFGRMSGTEYTFVRNAKGTATGLIFRRGTIEARTVKISTQSPKVDRQRLDPYVGRYEFTPDVPITIARAGDGLVAQWVGSSTEIFPASETNFFSRTLNAQFTFVKSGQGEVTGLVLHEGGLNPEAKKVK